MTSTLLAARGSITGIADTSLSEAFAITLALRIDHVLDAPDPAKDTDIIPTAGPSVTL